MKKKDPMPAEVRESVKRIRRSLARRKSDAIKDDFDVIAGHLERLFEAEAILVSKFPQLEQGLSSDSVHTLANDYLSTLSGPGEIDFWDQIGSLRKIVFEHGDAETGIPAGWRIPQKAEWEVVPAGFSMATITLEKSSRAVMHSYILFQDILRGENFRKREDANHPDTLSEDAEEKFRDIMAAFKIILDNLPRYGKEPEGKENGTTE